MKAPGRRAEEVLRQSETRSSEPERELRLMLDSIPTITWRAGPDGYVQQLNKRWFEYTGTTPEQARGWRWKLSIHTDDLENIVDTGHRSLHSGQPLDAQEGLRRFDRA